MLCTTTYRWPSSWLMTSGPFDGRAVARPATASTVPPAGVRISVLADRLGRRAVRRVEPNDDGIAPPPVDDFRRRHPADACLDGLAHVGDVQAVARDRGAIEVDLELHRTRAHADRYVLGAAHALDDALDLVRLLLEQRQAVAVDLDAELGLHAGDHFVEPHRHRRAELVVEPGDLRERGVHARNQRRRANRARHADFGLNVT